MANVTPTNQPQQFRILDLFGWITIAALLLTLAAPFLRRMEPAQKWRIYVMVLVQALIVIGVMVYGVHTRRTALSGMGQRLGLVQFGNLAWRHWPAVKSVAQMFLFAAFQLQLAIVFVLGDGRFSVFVTLLQSGQLAFFTGYAISRFMWQAYPGTAEVFEGGVVRAGVNALPWERVAIRPSTVFPERLVFVFQSLPNMTGGETKTSLVTGDLKDRLLELGTKE